MSANSINSPYPIFTDVDGNPLESGYIYIGQPNENPQSVPKSVYWDAAMSVPAAQPIRTSGGYPVRNGTPARLYVDGDYSITVRNKNSSFIYSAAQSTERISGDLISSIGSNKVIYNQGGAGAVDRTATARLQDQVWAEDFGFSTSASASANKTALEAALAASDVVNFRAGTYPITGPINIVGKVLRGAGKFKTILQVPGTNTQTTVFYNNKTSSASWGSGGGMEMRDLQIKGNWDGSTALADASWDNTAALVKWGAGSFVEMVNVDLNYSYGHNASFYRLGYSTFDRMEVAAARKNGLHFEAPSGGDAITSTWVENSSVHSNRGLGNIYIKNGVGFFCRGITFEDSNCGLYIDGVDNRNVTVLTSHAESCPQGIINFQGSGTNTCLIDNFADAAITRSNPQFQTMIAYGNNGGALNAIEQEWTFGNPAVSVNTTGVAAVTGGGGSAYIRTRSGHAGYFTKPYAVFEARLTTNQYGDSGPQMYAMAYGNINEDKMGWTWSTRTGASNANYDKLHLLDTGHLLPGVDGAQNIGSLSFYNGTSSVPMRWKDICATNGTIQTSDGREKTDVKDTSLGLSFINDLRPVSYKWIDSGMEYVDELDENGNYVRTTERRTTGKRDHQGMIAQEVLAALAKHGMTTDQFAGFIQADPNNPDSSMGLRYSEFIAPLIRAVQELSDEIKQLKTGA